MLSVEMPREAALRCTLSGLVKKKNNTIFKIAHNNITKMFFISHFSNFTVKSILSVH